jgi:TatD DNase family protein
MPSSWIDTHAHLDDESFQTDLVEVLARAESVGIRQIVTIAVTQGSSMRAQRLAQSHPMIFASVGIQPNHVAEARAGDWDEVVRLVGQAKVVAIGETGLDRHWDFTPFPQQEEYFARHLALSRESKLPLVIHCREAEADIVRMLRDDFDRHGPIHGVRHSFTGDANTVAACLAMGLHISFAGMLTYKNAEPLRAVAAGVPLDRLLVETDSPYLVPVPLRGKVKRNEPGHVIHTGACLAQIKGVSGDTLAAQTTRNARELFALPGLPG